jgi:hypothetical protein
MFCSNFTDNGFRFYAVVVFVGLKCTIVLKLIEVILLSSYYKTTIAYKLLLAAYYSSHKA